MRQIPENGIERLFTGAFACSLDSSIHLLANDTGCVWRHSYDPETGAVSPFRSGYVNRSCEPEGRRARRSLILAVRARTL
ncbi:MAG: hypothetical protein LC740_17710 [Actinobacteria bacterium]|nr:hypothetical protein [Actinomycetota bacterium]